MSFFDTLPERYIVEAGPRGRFHDFIRAAWCRLVRRPR